MDNIAECTKEIKKTIAECSGDTEDILMCTDKIKDSLKDCIEDVEKTKKCTKKIKKKVYKSYDFLKGDVAEFIED